MKKHYLLSGIIFLFLILATIVVILYGEGYRFGLAGGTPQLSKTGLLVATSLPNGAQVFIDGHLTTATDSTLNLAPGTYDVKIYKEGYFAWEKQLVVKQEVVTNANALLLPVAPKLESVATVNVLNPVLDPSGTKLAFEVASESARKNGIYVLDMGSSIVPIPSLQSPTTQIVDDTLDTFSQAHLTWSPDSSELIASISSQTEPNQTPTTYLLKTNTFNDTPQDITAVLPATLNVWKQQIAKQQKQTLQGLKPKLLSMMKKHFQIVSWSPDQTNILYIASDSATLPLIIKPRLLGIDTLVESRTIKQGGVYVYDTKNDLNIKILDSAPDTSCLDPETLCRFPLMWYPDSKHLIYVNNKQISVMDYDGTNDKVVYAGPFVDHYVFPWPNGAQIVILTNLGNPETSPTLYTVGLQ